jgi:hypothetical protein
MADSSIKKVKLTGLAATSAMKTRKVAKRGGAILSPAPLVSPAAAPAPAAVAKQTDKAVKVVLAPSKKKQTKVILAPPVVTKTISGKNKTLKVARRIRMNVDGLTRKMNRAKTIKKESEKMPMDTMKKELVSAGLIKTESKAPDAILRQMYSDFQMLKQRAL